MSNLSRVYMKDLTESDLRWLIKACAAVYTGESAEQIMINASYGTMQLWRLEGDKLDGILITQIMTYPAGRELYIWSVAGRGYARKMEEIYYGTLLPYAKKKKCKWITGAVIHERLGKFYEGVGAEKVSILYKYNITEN